MALHKPRVYCSKCSVLLANVKTYLLDLDVSYSIFLAISWPIMAPERPRILLELRHRLLIITS